MMLVMVVLYVVLLLAVFLFLVEVLKWCIVYRGIWWSRVLLRTRPIAFLASLAARSAEEDCEYELLNKINEALDKAQERR